MRIGTTLFMIVLLSSCQPVDTRGPARSEEDIMKRREEVRQIVAAYLERPIEVIRGPLTVKEVGKELAESAKGSPGGWGLMWAPIKAKLKPGDEIYFYRSEVPYGYVVIRGNEVVATLRMGLR